MRRITVAVLLVVAVFCFVTRSSRAQQASEGTRKVLTRIAPQYPHTATHFALQGAVKIEAVVSPNGTVKSLEVKGGHPLLAQAAQNAVRGWKWEPAPHETHETVEVKFNPE